MATTFGVRALRFSSNSSSTLGKQKATAQRNDNRVKTVTGQLLISFLSVLVPEGDRNSLRPPVPAEATLRMNCTMRRVSFEGVGR